MEKDTAMKLFVYAMREFDELKYFEECREKYGITFDHTTAYPNMENIALARGSDAVSVITNPIGKELLGALADMGVKYLATRSIGYEHIDVEEARRLGIRVCHASYSPNSVANYTIMLMLMACRNINYILEKSRLQDYSLGGKIGKELSLCTVGVIGTGKIGETVIEHLSGFGCKMLAYDLYEKDSVKRYAEYVDLEQLYRESDIITLHIPGMEENYHMLDKKAFEKMKDGVTLVNAARGMLVDTDALIAALESGKVGFAALDTVEEENGLYYLNREGDIISNRHRAVLGAFPNVILSPHMAFYTEQAVSDMVGKTVEAMVQLSKGEETLLEVGQ